MSIQLHARYFPVATAENTFAMDVLKLEDKRDLAMEEVTGALLAIAAETNKVEKLQDRKAPDLDDAGMAIYRSLLAVEKTHELTVGESMKVLLGFALSMNKYVIRHERHPNDPDKKGDEA